MGKKTFLFDLNLMLIVVYFYHLKKVSSENNKAKIICYFGQFFLNLIN